MAEEVVKIFTERVKTGIPGLDTVLKGGLLRAGVYLIMGCPGAGKTIAGNQMAFHHVAGGGRAVYMTLLGESHDRMLAYIHGMKFFDLEVIPDKIHYVSGYSLLERDGLPGLLQSIRKEIVSSRATLFVLDGLVIAEEMKQEQIGIKKMIHELQAIASLASCTMVLLTVTDSSPSREYTGYTMVDGMIELSEGLIGPRSVRELQVRKLRGTDFLKGKHTFDISSNGLAVYPRTEVLLAHPPEVSAENRERQKFGVTGLDEMLQGGVYSGSMTTILGAPGTGKTLLGISFLTEGARLGERGIYFGFYEPPQRLIDKARKVGIDIDTHSRSGMVDLVWQPPLEHLLDGLAERLLVALRRTKARRVFIDGLEGFKSATLYPERLGSFLAAITNELRAMDVTAIFSEETELFKSDIEMPVRELASVIENIIFLRYVEFRSQLHRVLSIIKVRESGYDSRIRGLDISDRGLFITDTMGTAAKVLSGHLHPITSPGISPAAPAGE